MSVWSCQRCGEQPGQPRGHPAVPSTTEPVPQPPPGCANRGAGVPGSSKRGAGASRHRPRGSSALTAGHGQLPR